MSEQRKIEISDAPKRRYEDVKKAAATAADRIGAATQNLVNTFREAYREEYNRPRENAASLVTNTAAE